MFNTFGIRGRQVLVAALLASGLCAVLATRVFVSFEGRRVKLIRSPVIALEGVVGFNTAVDRRTAALAAPVAVIASIRHHQGSSAVFSIYVDGRRVCEVGIPAGISQRVDCSVNGGWVRRPDHVVDVRGPLADWTLDSFELASHHGSSTHGVPLVILPDAATGLLWPPPVTVAVAWVLFTLLLVVPAPSHWPRALTLLHRGLATVGVILFAGALVSPWLSSFLVVISAGGFAKAVAVLLAPQLSRVGAVLWTMVAARVRPPAGWRPIVQAGAIGVIVLLAHGVVLRSMATYFDGRVSGLLRVSEQTFDRVPFLRERPDVRASLVLLPDGGYDAQFHYFAMFDPLMQRYRDAPERYRAVADAPPYRFGRIGIVWVARAVAGTHWDQYPLVLVVLVWIGTGLSAAALALIAHQSGRHPAWGLLVLAVPGLWQSASMALPEPLAVGLLLMGYWCVRTRHVAAATAMFAASLLIRETGVLFVVPVAVFAAVAGLSWRARAALLCSVIPGLVWRCYVCWVLWPDWGWQGFFYSPHSLDLPFAGLAELGSRLASGAYFPGTPILMSAAALYAPLLVVAAAVAVVVARRVDRAVGVALVLYALVAVSLSYQQIWVHVGNAQRASYEVFVLLAVASMTLSEYPRAVRSALVTVWTASVLYLCYGAVDASVLRGALLPW